jgi:hypothetical protein
MLAARVAAVMRMVGGWFKPPASALQFPPPLLTSGLEEPYRAAWLEQATPWRLPSALMRFDAEWVYWKAVQQAVVEKALHGRSPCLPSCASTVSASRSFQFPAGGR